MTAAASAPDPFCSQCGVTNDLHDGPDTCASAQSKARILELFDRVAGVR